MVFFNKTCSPRNLGEETFPCLRKYIVLVRDTAFFFPVVFFYGGGGGAGGSEIILDI